MAIVKHPKSFPLIAKSTGKYLYPDTEPIIIISPANILDLPITKSANPGILSYPTAPFETDGLYLTGFSISHVIFIG